MPALIGYMLAIVVTLGGYFVGLQWLISPADPWQANTKMQTASSHAVAARKRAPVIKPVEAEPGLKEAAINIAAAEPPAAVPVTAAAAFPAEPAAAPLPPKHPAVTSRAEENLSARAEAARPELRRETRRKPVHRKLASANSGRKLQLMVLRTYEGPDGRRFSRLLSLNEARNAMAFQPPW
jgi:hypothetical protein